ncbi:Hypothetical protein Y17_0478 [Pectobacterium wasabiae CFBP 3304]|nr:Hypothetical protein Y17_0478 [Pectobacterium wasabiae CFBP 3304]
MSEKKDKNVQLPQDTKKESVNEKKIESVNTPVDSVKREKGCNRKNCYCVR